MLPFLNSNPSCRLRHLNSVWPAVAAEKQRKSAWFTIGIKRGGSRFGAAAETGTNHMWAETRPVYASQCKPRRTPFTTSSPVLYSVHAAGLTKRRVVVVTHRARNHDTAAERHSAHFQFSGKSEAAKRRWASAGYGLGSLQEYKEESKGEGKDGVISSDQQRRQMARGRKMGCAVSHACWVSRGSA